MGTERPGFPVSRPPLGDGKRETDAEAMAGRYARRLTPAKLMKLEMSLAAGFEPEPDPAGTAFDRLAVDLGLAVEWAGPIRRRVNAAVVKPAPAGQGGSR